MKFVMGLLLIGGIAFMSGCSAENAKRVTYEMLQEVRVQQCTDDISNECPETQSYDDYQQERNSSQ